MTTKPQCWHQDKNVYSWVEYDARGIPLARVCEKCVDDVLAKYRSDVLTDSNYIANEPIEPED
jgi:hypothetical protein